LVAPMARDRRITVTVEENDQVGYVFVDAKRLTQILINLLSNAIKYNRKGGSVDVACEVFSDTVRVNVTDSGPGIARENLERIFTPFDRLDADGTQTEGTGLGLALAKTFAEAMGATIGVRSVVGEGSTFWIDLPTESPAN
jgi:signal transduction histidine kinase